MEILPLSEHDVFVETKSAITDHHIREHERYEQGDDLVGIKFYKKNVLNINREVFGAMIDKGTLGNIQNNFSAANNWGFNNKTTYDKLAILSERQTPLVVKSDGGDIVNRVQDTLASQGKRIKELEEKSILPELLNINLEEEKVLLQANLNFNVTEDSKRISERHKHFITFKLLNYGPEFPTNYFDPMFYFMVLNAVPELLTTFFQKDCMLYRENLNMKEIMIMKDVVFKEIYSAEKSDEMSKIRIGWCFRKLLDNYISGIKKQIDNDEYGAKFKNYIEENLNKFEELVGDNDGYNIGMLLFINGIKLKVSFSQNIDGDEFITTEEYLGVSNKYCKIINREIKVKKVTNPEGSYIMVKYKDGSKSHKLDLQKYRYVDLMTTWSKSGRPLTIDEIKDQFNNLGLLRRVLDMGIDFNSKTDSYLKLLTDGRVQKGTFSKVTKRDIKDIFGDLLD